MLIDLLAEAARGRGLLPSGQRPGPETLFALVRDIPYGRASSREPEAIVAEWPRAASALGMVVNEAFRPGQDMTLACEPIERFEVPEGVDPQPFKESLIARHCGPDRARREAFIEGLAAWLARAMP